MTPLEQAAAWARHPLAQRWAQRVQASGDNRVRTAEDVLGERLVRLSGMLVYENARPGEAVLATSATGPTRMAWLRTHLEQAASATPYLWTEETRLALGSIELPRHVLSPRMLPQPRTWHTFFTGIGMGGRLTYQGREYEGQTGDALLVVDVGTHFIATVFGSMTCVETGEDVPTISGASVPYGVTFPDEFADDESARNLVMAPALMFSFLNSPYIPKRRERLGRGARRECARHGAAVDDDHVTFVVLRRPESTRRKVGEESPVDWKHRWLVSGHVRAQWYPSEQAHRLIWIAPYLKGPEDAPMLEHAYKVAR